MSAVEFIERADARLGIWRDAPGPAGARTAALGAFACADAEAGARLLDEAADKLAAERFTALIGPMDGDTWHAHRLVIETDGSAPFLMEPRNPAHYPEAFMAAGFEIAARYASAARLTSAPVPDAPCPDGVILRAFDGADVEAELARIHAVSLRAFARNAFFTPIPLERFVAAYLPVACLLDPNLVLMAEDRCGRLVGFLFGVPNFTEGAAPGAVVLKTYASLVRGVGGALAQEFHRRARDRGYVSVIHALMHEANPSMRHSEKLNARAFRRYALWAKRL